MHTMKQRVAALRKLVSNSMYGRLICDGDKHLTNGHWLIQWKDKPIVEGMEVKDKLICFGKKMSLIDGEESDHKMPDFSVVIPKKQDKKARFKKLEGTDSVVIAKHYSQENYVIDIGPAGLVGYISREYADQLFKVFNEDITTSTKISMEDNLSAIVFDFPEALVVVMPKRDCS